MNKNTIQRILILPALAFCAFGSDVSAQAVADTTLSIQDIEIRGRRFAGLSSGEVKRLQVENNLSSLAVTTAEAFRQVPSLITDIEGGITYRGSSKPGMLINGIPYGLLEEYSGDVLIQLAAVRSALNNTAKVILKDHIEHCVMDAAEHGDKESLEQLNRAIEQFMT